MRLICLFIVAVQLSLLFAKGGGNKKKQQKVCKGGTCKAYATASEPKGNRNLPFIDDYHFPMLTDDARNDIYYQALQRIINPNTSTSVLDVGAGSMLLSMMALKLGASKVLGVEADTTMCKAAKEVLKANGLTDKYKQGHISLFEGKFQNLKVEPTGKLKEPVDVFVSETFDAALIGEGYLPILAHAKSSGMLLPSATVIPNSAVVFAQLLESTLSLSSSQQQQQQPRGNPSETRGMFNLEPMRKYRRARAYNVRYLNETNAIRQQLSTVKSMFQYDFQNFDVSQGMFLYTCLLFEITEAEEGLFDSIGIWFNLYLDADRSLVLSNAPYPSASQMEDHAIFTRNRSGGGTGAEHRGGGGGGVGEEGTGTPPVIHVSSHWMQALYRTSQDVYVQKGDFVRIQVVQTESAYIFSDIGTIRGSSSSSSSSSNDNSRLIRFNTIDCHDVPVDVYSFDVDDSEYVELDNKSRSMPDWLTEDSESIYLLGTIPAPTSSSAGKDKSVSAATSYAVFPARVFQVFLIRPRIVSRATGKPIAMLYQLPDSTANLKGPAAVKGRLKIPLDSYDIMCPDQ